MKIRLPALACVLSCCLLAPAVSAQSASPAPGEYLTERGWGRLLLKPAAAGGAQAFAIEAQSANAHVCMVEGSLREQQARIETGGSEPACVIDFTPTAGGLRVTPTTPAACRYFCGEGAQFSGLYLQPAPGCRSAEVKQARASFKQQFDKKDYARARATLAPVLAACAKLLTESDQGWVRNDLALTLYRLGDAAECRRVLAPLAELVALSDEQLRDTYAAAYVPTQERIARATRANLKLCGAGAK